MTGFEYIPAGAAGAGAGAAAGAAAGAGAGATAAISSILILSLHFLLVRTIAFLSGPFFFNFGGNFDFFCVFFLYSILFIFLAGLPLIN